MTNKSKCCGIDLGAIAKDLRDISEKNRLKIICLLKQKEYCVCEFQSNLGISHNLICHHLKALSRIGIINSRSKGKFTFYKLNNQKYHRLIKNINKLLGGKNVCLSS